MQRDAIIARVALAVAFVAVASVVSLAVFFAVGDPFGTVNDVGNAVLGLLGALLAVRLGRYGPARTGRLRSTVAAGLAVAGAAVTVVGSWLVISGATGFFLAGLVSSVGFALIGLWLVELNVRLGSTVWPRRMSRFGIATGVFMAVGFLTLPGIAMGLDDMAAAPGWIWIGYLGWLGTYVLYPAWSFWLGRTLLREP